jgi:hypothetical protein
VSAGEAFVDKIDWQPWFAEAIGRLHLRKGSRVLMLTASTPDLANHALAAVGRQGHVTVLEPDRDRAARAEQLEHDGLAVISYRPEGQESFGPHDGLVACPATDPDWPPNLWGAVAKANLRPGGRFVVDLPAPRHCEVVEDACGHIGAPAELLAHWNGPSEAALAQLLQADGLRAIEPQSLAFPVAFPSPHEAALVVCDRLGAGRRLVDSLQLALARQFGTNGPIELLFRRSRVTGMR